MAERRSPSRSFALLALVCCAAAHAGPPFLTDDPEPVDLHRTEVNLALQATRADASRAGTFGAEANYGCARETQCHVVAYQLEL